jgi:hypothetical protein
MRKQDGGYDYHRYRRLLAEAVDETKRLALIELLIEEKARDRLAAERASEGAATVVMNIAKVLGTTRGRPVSADRASPDERSLVVPLRLIKDIRQQP